MPIVVAFSRPRDIRLLLRFYIIAEDVRQAWKVPGTRLRGLVALFLWEMNYQIGAHRFFFSRSRDNLTWVAHHMVHISASFTFCATAFPLTVEGMDHRRGGSDITATLVTHSDCWVPSKVQLHLCVDPLVCHCNIKLREIRASYFAH